MPSFPPDVELARLAIVKRARPFWRMDYTENMRHAGCDMNLALANSQITAPITWHLMVESLADGQVAAWVAELPDSRVVAASREAAIAQLEPLVDKRIASIDAVEFQPQLNSLTATEHPALKFIGIFENDPDFADILADMRAERELTDDNPAYT
jgi:hypothetical protein